MKWKENSDAFVDAVRKESYISPTTTKLDELENKMDVAKGNSKPNTNQGAKGVR